MLENNGDPEIILGKVKRQMNTLSISHQGPSTSRSVEDRVSGGGILSGVPPIVRNDPGVVLEIFLSLMSNTGGAYRCPR